MQTQFRAKIIESYIPDKVRKKSWKIPSFEGNGGTSSNIFQKMNPVVERFKDINTHVDILGDKRVYLATSLNFLYVSKEKTVVYIRDSSKRDTINYKVTIQEKDTNLQPKPLEASIETYE